MEEIRDYYAFLGVPRNATPDEIKRAYARKRREYLNDETKSTQLNQVYEVLCDSAKRKQYDLNVQYGNQVEDIKEKIRNSETLEQRDKHLVDAKKIYLDILKNDAENVDALWNLVGIEELLENDAEAIQYLKQLEKCVEEADDKIQVYHRLGEIYRRLGNVDEAIKCYHAIYKADAAYVEDIKILVRLCYEDKKNLKAAIQILNDCINRSTDSRLKIVYLYETLRAIRLLQVSSYQKVEDTLYKKLESFRTDNEETNLANAATILTCFKDTIDREDFKCFHRLEQVYLLYAVKHPQLNQAFKAVQQIVPLIEKGKLHKVIDLYLEEQWTKEIREQIGRLIVKEAEQIKASLESIKKEAPEYWKSENELVDLEKLVNENLKVSKEFNSLSNDRTISYYMKKMMECILLDGFVAFEDMKDEFVDARDSFFEEEDKGKLQHTLRKMEEFYPICYKLFADIFFSESNAAKETVNQAKGEQHSNLQGSLNVSKGKGLGYLWGYFLGGILLSVAFPLGLIVVVATYIYGQSIKQSQPTAEEIRAEQERKRQEELERKEKQKKNRKILKRICILAGIIYVGVVVFNIGSIIKESIELKQEQEYLESHNFFLTDEELEKRNNLDDKYDRITMVDIHVMQANPYNAVDYPEEDYIWLMIWNYGYKASCELKSNYLSAADKDAIYQEISVLYDGEKTDFEKCEEFYELAYAYIVEHEANIVEVPELLGLTYIQAEQLLEKYNLHISVENYEYSSEYAIDAIKSQYPAVGDKIEKGQTIYVAVSLGEEPKQVIDNNSYYEDNESERIYYDMIDGRHLNLDGKGEIIIEHISENKIRADITLTDVSYFSIVLEKTNGIYTYTNGECYITFAYDEGFNLHVSCSGEKTEEFPYWEEMCEIFGDTEFALGG